MRRADWQWKRIARASDIDRVEEARKAYELYLKSSEEIREYRAHHPIFEGMADDGLGPSLLTTSKTSNTYTEKSSNP